MFIHGGSKKPSYCVMFRAAFAGMLLVFFAHGAQKMLGWFGGFGFSGTMGFFTGMRHIPGRSQFS
jgi:hypothetical protein